MKSPPHLLRHHVSLTGRLVLQPLARPAERLGVAPNAAAAAPPRSPLGGIACPSGSLWVMTARGLPLLAGGTAVPGLLKVRKMEGRVDIEEGRLDIRIGTHAELDASLRASVPV
jgi:hypothetical protein